MSESTKRSVSLPTDLARAIDDAVAVGEYVSTDAAIGEALKDWKERRENFGYTIAELRAEIQKGIDSGQGEPGEPVLEGLSDRYSKLGGSAAAAE